MITFCTTKNKDYEMSKEQWLEERQGLMENIADDGVYCKGCGYNIITKDPFGTGDSPTVRECDCSNPDECPGVQEEWYEGCMK